MPPRQHRTTGFVAAAITAVALLVTALPAGAQVASTRLLVLDKDANTVLPARAGEILRPARVTVAH